MVEIRHPEFKFKVEDAVVWEGKMAKVEECHFDGAGKNVYLIQTANHLYHYVYEENLEVYIG